MRDLKIARNIAWFTCALEGVVFMFSSNVVALILASITGVLAITAEVFIRIDKKPSE